MANEIVASNDLVRAQATLLRSFFDNNYSLRLYANPLKPTPANTVADFVEPGWTGYTRKNMTGQWGQVMKIMDGEWGFISKTQLFGPLVGVAQVVYGWFLVGDLKLQLSARFPVPILVRPGDLLPVQVNCQNWSTSLLCTSC